jgi:hypothetical protein
LEQVSMALAIELSLYPLMQISAHQNYVSLWLADVPVLFLG